ncbi:unnamed protein product [Paramecium pentaurelia]|uniref:Cyclic nucleotide-binding domain-containing protein n=1 Tax=Paramecium pentaurelia TaxID=43138 RepID=A0A8S1TD24_9CILI|nr:unnamed protein product [Paramecium pentaurelia]
MEQIIQNDNLVLLQQKILSYPKTYEDLKTIASIIKVTQIFNKLNELYHQQLSQEGQIKLCNYLEITNYQLDQQVQPSQNSALQLILKGQVEVYFLEEGYIYQHEKYLTTLDPLFYIEEDFQFDKIKYQQNQLLYKASINNSILLTINKKECDEIFKYYGEIFLFKHRTLCKIIPGLGELNSKRILESLANQFENIILPNCTIITEENQIGEYLFFLAQGHVSFQKNKEHIFNMEESGIIGDELLIDPDQDQNSLQTYYYTVIANSAQVLLYRIKLKIFSRLFPNAIIRQIITQHKQKQVIRLLVGSKPIEKQKFNTSPTNEIKKSKSTLILTKDSIKAYDKVDIIFQQYQVPKHSRVLKFNNNLKEKYNKKFKKTGKKITINEFVQQTKQSDVPQMKLLEKVENPYNFASNVNTEGFLKKYYSNLIRIGLVKPPLRIAPQNQEAIQRSRVISAMKLIEHTHNQLKPKRATSAAFGKADPLLSINALVSTKESEINVSTQKQLEKNKTMTTIYPTPRTQSQPQLGYHTNVTPRYSSVMDTPKCDTPQSRSTMAKSSQQVFRPYSGFMDHTSRLSQQSEINKRLKRPNQIFF